MDSNSRSLLLEVTTLSTVPQSWPKLLNLSSSALHSTSEFNEEFFAACFDDCSLIWPYSDYLVRCHRPDRFHTSLRIASLHKLLRIAYLMAFYSS